METHNTNKLIFRMGKSKFFMDMEDGQKKKPRTQQQSTVRRQPEIPELIILH